MRKTTGQEAEAYLLEIPRFTTKNRVQDTAVFLEVLGNPQNNQKIVHVAGTNGKGSVCAYLCSVLTEAGYRVGMFTSPHLESMRERFRIGGEAVEESCFASAFDTVMEHLDQARKKVGREDYHPTFFEFLFLMGMIIFREKETEYLILETGLGGRLDATNAIEQPLLTVITGIGLDHMEYLGETLEEIAMEKAGILKPGVPVVYCDKKQEASQVIRNRAEMLGNRAVAVGKETAGRVSCGKKGIDFSVHSRYYGYIDLHLPTRALYQVENAGIALKCVEEIDRGRRITREQLVRGLTGMYWPGRMEEIAPGIFLDGAHNEDGIEALCHTAGSDGCTGRRLLLFAAAADKAYSKMIRRIAESGLFHHVVVTGMESSRAAAAEILFREFRGAAAERMPDCTCTAEAAEGLALLQKEKREEDYVYIAGSLYLAGEIKALLRRHTGD